MNPANRHFAPAPRNLVDPMSHTRPIDEQASGLGFHDLLSAVCLDGQFAAVQQAIGTPKARTKAAAWLKDFVEEAKASGFVQSLIDKHEVVGLSVAGPA